MAIREEEKEFIIILYAIQHAEDTSFKLSPAIHSNIFLFFLSTILAACLAFERAVKSKMDTSFFPDWFFTNSSLPS